MTKKMILGAAATLLSFGALQIPAASAHGVHREHHPFLVISTYNEGCGAYYWKWQHTGELFWKRRYFSCRGIY
jgi:hypothetical protein